MIKKHLYDLKCLNRKQKLNYVSETNILNTIYITLYLYAKTQSFFKLTTRNVF